jgi:uncharacterized protein YyaL (SSP411 family)
MKFRGLLSALIIFVAPLVARAAEPLVWHEWSSEVFAQAKRENKFVLLDLEAVWCHWCHVMAETTYRDPAVVALMNERYLAVRVDQDARPDLASRYEDYGWPATVIYAPDSTEIVKKQGYIPPADMTRLLRAVIDDPSPVAAQNLNTDRAATSETALPPARLAELRARWTGGYDDQQGGWGFSHKYLDADSIEYALRLAARGDTRAAQMARDTLRLSRQLIDPVWGGVYQYSAGGTWDEPHFEKIMSFQADTLRACAQAAAQWGDPAHLESARAVHGYLRRFLTSPEGVVYTSQDADLVPGEHSADYFALDDAGRRARGLPRIDRHVYARENGWVIAALAQLAAVTGEAGYRTEAERAAQWVLAHRSLGGGGFRHDEHDAAGPYLGDSLAMGRAFLSLHQLTQDPAWLAHAEAAATFIEAHFKRAEAAGYAAGDSTKESFPAPRPQFDENLNLVRFTTALAHVTGRAGYRAMAQHALRWLLAPGVADSRGFSVAGLLLAEEEARTDPIHVMIIGGRDDPVAAAMFATALRVPEQHKLVEWWDRRTGPAPRGADIFPEMDGAAAFLCANGACSAPVADAAALQRRLTRLNAPR